MGIDKINIGNLENWNRGDDLEARKLQQPVDTLKSLGGVAPPKQEIPSGKSIQLKMFKVDRLDTDVIICFTWNGIEKGTDEIKVALPFLLRQTPFDVTTRIGAARAGIEYEYSDNNKRLATNVDDEEEDQIIVDSYEVDDIIFAMKGIFGGTSLYHDDPTNEKPVVWLDTNVDGRYWALDTEAEDEEEE